MKKFILLVSVMLLANIAKAEYLCSYEAQLSDNDKYNSSGNYIATSYTKSAAAGVLRQDRANYHKFGVRDPFDQGDCVFYIPANRAKLESWLARGKMPTSVIHRIIDGNPLIHVDIYSNSIDVYVR
ncbi:hypothetical protein [Lonepinella sp. BR2474]|uniref:hypothetical protein n=1 Tax=Lonepinella sp. BR2474 TaxID=3434548 RepID=UPI003F6DDE64